MIHFIQKWLNLYVFNQNMVHNVVLALVYAGVIWQFYRWFKELMNSRGRGLKFSRVLSSFVGLFLVCFLLGSLMLYLLQPEFLLNWRFTGWLYSDIVLVIIYLVIVVSAVLFFLIYRKKKQNIRASLKYFIGMLVVEFFIGSFFLLIFTTGFSQIVFTSESPIVISNEKQPMLVNKVEKRVPNGTTNGISTSNTSFLLSSIDLNSGKENWHRHSSWQEYLIGATPNGLFMVNTKKESVYFLDQKTGKQKLSEEEWIKEIPELAGNLSYAYTDYCIVKEALYFYGLDGNYYKVDLKTNQVTEKEEYQEIIRNQNLFALEHTSSRENTDLQKQVATLYPKLLEVTLGTKQNDQTALVVYKAKRNAKNAELALVATEEPKIYWQATLALSEDTDLTDIQVFSEKDKIYALTGKDVYKLQAQTGKVVYKYSYQLNQVE
jgi:hypothetical protein